MPLISAMSLGIVTVATNYRVENISINSSYLKREVAVTYIYPKDGNKPLKLLLFNDGQDFEALKLEKTYSKLLETRMISPALIVGIHANEKRIREYGIVGRPDYLGRGDLAGDYENFVLNELMPEIKSRFEGKLKDEPAIFSGFSLGGLSAFHIVWRNPTVFSKNGVFSGSFWWRSKAFNPTDPDGNRILLDEISKNPAPKNIQFWIQAGTKDEKDDRNNNGIIDAVDDSLDLIQKLSEKGYRAYHDVLFTLTENGEHNPSTWAREMPKFLEWALNPKN
jgi:enterochelin esterase-like enzyme